MENKVLIETSARHIHLSQADLETLVRRRLYPDPEEGAVPARPVCLHRAPGCGGKQKDPARRHHPGPCAASATQVELSLTDARSIGVTGAHPGSGRCGGSGSAAW